MKLIIKQIIVMIITFLIIFWFQNNDDIKHKRKRETIFDKIKLPLLVSTIIGLIFNIPLLFNINECVRETNINESVSIQPLKEINLSSHSNIKDIINNLQISTDMPDF
jgi:predicted permease